MMLHPGRVVEHQSASSCCAGRCVVVRVHGLWIMPSVRFVLCSLTSLMSFFKRVCMLITVFEQCFRLLQAFVNLVFVPTSTILFLCCPTAAVSLNRQMGTLRTILLLGSASGENRGTIL